MVVVQMEFVNLMVHVYVILVGVVMHVMYQNVTDNVQMIVGMELVILLENVIVVQLDTVEHSVMFLYVITIVQKLPLMDLMVV